MERADIKLAIDMLESLHSNEPCEDNLQLDHCINVFEDCGNEIANLRKQRDDLILAVADHVAVRDKYRRQRDELAAALESVQAVANESEGIVGWHRNGDMAYWDELLPEVDAALANVKEEA